MRAHGTVSRRKTNKILLYPSNSQVVDQNVAFNIEKFGRDLRSGILRDKYPFNADETQLFVHLYGNNSLAKSGDQKAK